MQRHFDRDIEDIKDLLLRMGAMVEDSIAQSIRALLERDTILAEEVIAHDDEIDRMEVEIDQRTIELIAEITQKMVREALDSFVRGDAGLARSVIRQDDIADALTEDSFRALLTYMLENPRNISPAIRLTFIGKYFERMADGATNICEMVVYLVEGKMIKHATPEGR